MEHLDYQYQHQGRVLAVQILYAHDLGGSFEELVNFSWLDDENKSYASDEAKIYARLLFINVLEKKDELDLMISSCLKQWTIERLKKVDLNLLRMATYWLSFQKDTPYQVVINETVSMAKSLSGEDSCGFINGVVDAIARKCH